MTNPPTPADPQQLRVEIEQTRAELGETVQRLAAKTDVKARAKHAVDDVGERARQKLTDVKDQAASALPVPVRRRLPLAVLVAAAAGVIVVAVLVTRRIRS